MRIGVIVCLYYPSFISKDDLHQVISRMRPSTPSSRVTTMPICLMAVNVSICFNFAALRRQWWCLLMNSMFPNGRKTNKQTDSKLKRVHWNDNQVVEIKKQSFKKKMLGRRNQDHSALINEIWLLTKGTW